LTAPAGSDTIAAVSARAYFLAFLGSVATVVACGARSDLAVGIPREVEDAGPDVVDAPDDVVDAPPDVIDAPFDAPPPICPEDGGVTFIYVISAENTLYSYYPPQNFFTFIGKIDCDPTGATTPFSMAVDRGGTAYVVFTDGHLYRVSTATAACEPTDFVPGQLGFDVFGMGFSSNTADPGETLYVAASPQNGGDSAGLGSIDTQSLALSYVGPFAPPLGRTELTGTGDARLFGFSLEQSGAGGLLSEIDKTSAQILNQVTLPVGNSNSAFAYAFWGGSFYIFTADVGTGTTVTRYDPSAGTVQAVGTNGDTIVGAGVSTCAPH
jgi:hypothetical protein